MQLSVIIPVLNEEKSVSKIIYSVLEQKEVAEIIVVNDGSTDNTPKVLDKIQTQFPKKSGPSLKIINHLKNMGKGAAIRTGIKNVKCEYLIIQDADLEYSPKEYQSLLEKASKKTAVYGSRIMGNNPHAYARTYLGNVLLTKFFNLLYGTRLTDSYTCYKLIPTKIAKSLRLTSNGFEIEAEITAKLAKRGIQIIEVPISYKPRSYEKGKKIKTKDALKGALTFLKLRII